jgi:hypothetical protein
MFYLEGEGEGEFIYISLIETKDMVSYHDAFRPCKRSLQVVVYSALRG